VLHVDVDAAEIARRLAGYAPPPPAFTRGVLGRYCRLVGSASDGATLS
jgi:dihydroxy-acid dehydratase